MTDRLTDWLKGQFSLDPQPDQPLLSAETAGDFALGFIPGVGQAMALRDMERARRANDPVAGGLAAASLVPFGKLGGALKNVIVKRNAPGAPHEMMDEAEKMLRRGGSHQAVHQQTGAFQDPSGLMSYNVPDEGAVFMEKALKQAKDDSYTGSLAGALRHPKLFQADPSLKDIQVELQLSGPNRGLNLTGGEYRNWNDSMWAGARSTQDLMDHVLHEVTHGAQFRANKAGIKASEGSAADAIAHVLREKYPNAPQEWIQKIAKQMYINNIGEAEARMPGGILRNPKLKEYSPRQLYRTQAEGVLWSEKSPKYREFDLDVINEQMNRAYIDELRRRRQGLLP